MTSIVEGSGQELPILVAPQTQRGRGMMNYSLANLVSKLPEMDSREVGSWQPPPEGRSSAVSGTAAASSREETAAETSQSDAAIIAEEATSESGVEPSMLEEPSDCEEAEESDGLQTEDPGQQLPDTASQTAAASRPSTTGPLSSQLAESQEETSGRLQTSESLAGRAVGDSLTLPVAGSTPAAANAPGKRAGPESRSPSISGSHSRGPRNAEKAFQQDQPAQNGAAAAHSGAAGGAGGGDDQEKSAEAVSRAGKDFMADITKNASEGRCSSCGWLATLQMLLRVQIEQLFSKVPP